MTSADGYIIKYLMGEESFLEHSLAKKYEYISNPDGTIRWIYPKDLKKPSFLNFYNTSTIRAKLLSTLIKIAFFMKQAHLVKKGEFKRNIVENSRLDEILKEYPNANFSIFTGTVGENRKIVLELNNEKGTFIFFKIALFESSKNLIINEATCLKYLNSFNLKSLKIPKLLSYNNQDTIGLSNIKPKIFQQNPNLTNVHIKALLELYLISNQRKKWSHLDSLKDSKERLNNLLKGYKQVNSLNQKRIENLSNKVLLLIDIIEDENDEVILAISHGDFTPWNSYISKNILYLFDWELSHKETPLMFDVFHFIFQSEIMIKHSSYKIINHKIENVLKYKDSKNILNTFKVNINKNYIFYLIYNISYYLNKYTKQKELHQQVFWLIDIWEDAVDDVINQKGVIFEK